MIWGQLLKRHKLSNYNGTRIDLYKQNITMPQKDEMNTLSEIMNKLTRKGYDKEFRWTPEGFVVDDKAYQPDNLTILKTYRFEGESDPADSAVLYVIEANDGLIGYSLDAYGAPSNQHELHDDFLRKINVEDRDEQIIFPD